MSALPAKSTDLLDQLLDLQDAVAGKPYLAPSSERSDASLADLVPCADPETDPAIDLDRLVFLTDDFPLIDRRIESHDVIYATWLQNGLVRHRLLAGKPGPDADKALEALHRGVAGRGMHWPPRKPKAEPVAANDNAPPLRATPWTFIDPRNIPPRRWIYGRHYIRSYVSVTVSPGGVGKTSKSIVEALSMATGRDLLGETVHERARVWLWNGEDPREELDRRIAAACTLYDIRAEDVDGWLFRDSGRDQPIVSATQTRDGTKIAVPVMDAMIDTIRANKIDVVIIDPFISSHAITENDNVAMDAVIKRFWAPIIDKTNCSVELIHHAKKTGGNEVTAESARGAVALIGAARSAIALNPMTQEEANRANVENRHLYFRATDAKANMAPREEKSRWYKLVSVDLGNDTPDRPSDHIGVATSWKWPDTLAGVTVSDLLAVQREISAGQYKDSSQAASWAGHAVAKVMGLDPNDPREREKIKSCLKAWKASGALSVEHREDDDRKRRPFVVVGEWAYPTESEG